MTTIKDANLNLPVEFWGHQNDSYWTVHLY